MYVSKIISIFLCFIIGRAFAQKPLRFTHLSTENGLSQNSVLSIVQDKNGFMWIGTQNGLNRYDAYNIKNFYEGTGAYDLKGDYILSLFQDCENRLWIGTNQGLHLYRPENESFVHFQPSVPSHSHYNNRENDIMDIAEDAQHVLWIGTRRGLLRFYPLSKRFQRIVIGDRHSDKPVVNDIFIDSSGRIWVATSTGLYVLEERSNGQIKIIHRLVPSGKQYKDSVCTSVVEDKEHNFWLGTMNHGLFKLDRNLRIVRNYSSLTSTVIDNHVRKLLYAPPNLFVATQNGLFSMTLYDEKITAIQHIAGNSESLAKNSLWSLFKSDDGTLWVGSYFGGLSIAKQHESSFYTWPNTNSYKEIADPVISAIVKDNTGNLWMSTEGNGLICANFSNNKYKVYSSRHDKLNSDLLKTLFLDKSNQLWIGSHGGGINVLSLQSNTLSYYPITKSVESEKTAETYCIGDYGKSAMLFGGNYGLKLGKTTKGGTLENESLIQIIDAATRVLLKLKSGTVLVGTSEGLYSLDNQKANILFKDINVNCMLAVNNDSLIWVGCKNGLYTYSTVSKKLTQFDDRYLLSNVLAINNDNEGNIWLSTNNGLYCITNNITVRHYMVTDGISSNQFNYNATYKDNNGQLYFGGNDGLTHFNPKGILVNNKVAELQLTNIIVLDTTVNKINQSQRTQLLVGKRSIELNYKQNSFTLNFALLNFIEPNKNHYLYQLAGYDKSWRTSNIPTATYINLPPGKYVFKIKGFNNDDVQSNMSVLDVTILSPWWSTWWAYCLYIALFISLVFGTIRYFVLRFFYKKEEEIHQKKLDFFTNVSHEIRTHLTLIVGPLSNLKGSNDTSIMNKTIIDVEKNANRLMSLVNELMDFRKMESGNIHLNIRQYEINEFLMEIYKIFLPISEFQQIDFEFVNMEESTMVYFDKAQMEKVFFNLLSNAFKFTPTNGKVSITLSKNIDQILITVADTGKGIDPIYKNKIFEHYYQVQEDAQSQNGYGIGLALSKKILELHHGDIKLLSPKNSIYSTIFEVALNLDKVYLLTEIASRNGNKDLPETKSAEISHTLILTNQPKETPIPQILYNKKLLVVEDNIRVQQLLSEILSPYFNVIIAGEAKSGMHRAITEMPDLIISDVMMPGLDGFGFCAQLKQDNITCHIPIILLTAKNAIDDYIEGLDNNADIYLTKPFDTRILLLHIRNLLVHQSNLQLSIRKNLLSNYVQETCKSETTAIDKLQTLESIGIKKQDEEFLKSLYRFVDANLEHPDLGVQMLEKEYHVSSPILYKKIQALTGCTIHEFIKLQKLKQASLLLKEGLYNVTEIAYKVGYSDRKYFSKEFKKFFGITPSDYHKKYAN